MEISVQLYVWGKRRQKRKGRVFDSCAGFCLPDGSVLSPDGAYITAEQAATLSAPDFQHFLRISPAFVVELLSCSGNLKNAEKKMRMWMANATKVAWLVNPRTRTVKVYMQGLPRYGETKAKVSGTGRVEGFSLALGEVWSCYGSASS